MVKPLTVFCAALFWCLALAPTPARAATPGQPPPPFSVRLLAVNGSGCPSGTTVVSAPTDTTFTVTYTQFTASAGGGASPADFRKNCQLNVLVDVPSGWTYGIASVRYRGFANLDKSARGTLQTSYYYAGLPGTFSRDHPIAGATDGDYEFNDQAPVITWAPCHFNATVNIDTSLQVFQGTNPCFFNELTMKSTDSLRLSFRQC